MRGDDVVLPAVVLREFDRAVIHQVKGEVVESLIVRLAHVQYPLRAKLERLQTTASHPWEMDDVCRFSLRWVSEGEFNYPTWH